MCLNSLLVVELEIFIISVARRLKTKEKQKKRKAYEPKLTPEGKPFHLPHCTQFSPSEWCSLNPCISTFFQEMMDSSTFKRFSLSIDNILENLEDVDFNGQGREIYPLFCRF